MSYPYVMIAMGWCFVTHVIWTLEWGLGHMIMFQKKNSFDNQC